MTKKLIVLLILFMSVMVIYSQKRVNYKESYNYMRAIELCCKAEYDEALPLVDSVLSKHPKEAKFHFFKAKILVNNGKYDEAIESLQKSLKYVSKKDSSEIGEIYDLRGDIYLQLKDTVQAINDYLTSLKYDNSNGTIYSLANTYQEQCNFEKSNEYYQILRSDDDILSLLYNSYYISEMIKNYVSMKEWDEVIAICSEVISQQDGHEDKKIDADVYYSRAKAYIAKDMWNEAASDFLKVLEGDEVSGHEDEIYGVQDPIYTILLSKLKIERTKNPGNIAYPLHISNMYSAHKQYDKAIATLKSYLELEPETSNLYEEFANIYIEKGDYENALRYINKALEEDDTNASNQFLKAFIMFNLGDPYGSIALCDKLIEEDPEKSKFYMFSGMVKSIISDYEGAEEDYSKYLVLETEDESIFCTRGYVYNRLGQIDRAKYDFNKVLEIEEKNSITTCTPYAYMGLGNTQRAIEIMDSLLTQHQDSAEIHLGAAYIYSLAQNKEKALQHLEKAFQLGYNSFYLTRNDQGFDFISNSPEFLTMVDKYEEELRSTFTYEEEETEDDAEYEYHTAEIPFTVEQSGLLKMKCTINGLPLDFLLDTGASTVMMSYTEYIFMQKNKYITPKDGRGTTLAVMADDSIVEESVINLRHVDFGGFTIENVKATVMPNLTSDLLLGQSVLNKAGKVEIDYENKILKITYKVKK